MAKAFSTIGVDPIIGAQIMDAIRATDEDLMDPKRIKKIQDIVKFFEGVENPENMIRRLTSGQIQDRLEHLWEWVELNKSEAEQIQEIKEMSASSGSIEAIQERIKERSNNIDQSKQDLASLMKEQVTNQKIQGGLQNLTNINNRLKQYE